MLSGSAGVLFTEPSFLCLLLSPGLGVMLSLSLSVSHAYNHSPLFASAFAVSFTNSLFLLYLLAHLVGFCERPQEAEELGFRLSL